MVYIICGFFFSLLVSFKQDNLSVNIPDPLHGIVGTPAVWATMEDAILSPRAHIAPSGGPVIKQRETTHPQLIYTAKNNLKDTFPLIKIGKILGSKL